MPESFGARLRQQRERQQITLTSIAEQTKINVPFQVRVLPDSREVANAR